jgi:hypothetical protein
MWIWRRGFRARIRCGQSRAIVDEALARLDGDFEAIYAPNRPAVDPALEQLLRALLLPAFYTVRSERQLMEQLVCRSRHRR